MSQHGLCEIETHTDTPTDRQTDRQRERVRVAKASFQTIASGWYLTNKYMPWLTAPYIVVGVHCTCLVLCLVRLALLIQTRAASLFKTDIGDGNLCGNLQPNLCTDIRNLRLISTALI